MSKGEEMVLRVILSIGIFSFLSGTNSSSAEAQASTSRNVILISVDGLGSKTLMRAKAPHIKALADAGVTARNARAVLPTITITNHASMISGVGPLRHRMVANFDWCPEMKVPSLFDLGRRQGRKTAMITAKTKLRCLVDEAQITSFKDLNRRPASGVAAETVKTLDDVAPQFLFVHFGDVDWAGHRFGWESSQQLAAVGSVDQAIREIVDAINQRPHLRDNTVVIITSDHGGQGRNHFGREEDQSIVWIAAGPGIRAGSVFQNPVTASDTAVMAAYFLGWGVPREWQWTGTLHR